MTDALWLLALLLAALTGLGVQYGFVVRRRVAAVGESLLELRRVLRENPDYVALEAGDAFHPSAAVESVTQDLSAHDFTMLGDRMQQRPGSSRRGGPSRWFVGRDGTVCGVFVALVTARGKVLPTLVLTSESDSGEYFITQHGGPRAHLAHPQRLSRERLDWESGVSAAVARHSAAVSRAAGNLVRMASLDNAMALRLRLRTHWCEWRDHQPPEPLLDADLRGVLGKGYDRFARTVGEYVRDHSH
jgi:hypothetical protein